MTGATTAWLYRCQITHARTGSASRSFSYGSYLWLVDLDSLPRLPLAWRPLAGFRVRDHLGDPAARSIRANVDAYLARNGIDLDGGRVAMLASASVFGYVFNPLSVFWCYDAGGRLLAVLAEVHNTYSERHVYLLEPDERGRYSTDKRFYVSPFLPMEGRYGMWLPEPGERLRLGVTLRTDAGPALVAGVRGRRGRPTPARLLGYLIRFPLAPLRVSVLIRWQAICLLARRVPLVPRPAGGSGEHRLQEGAQ